METDMNSSMFKTANIELLDQSEIAADDEEEEGV